MCCNSADHVGIVWPSHRDTDVRDAPHMLRNGLGDKLRTSSPKKK